MVWRAGGYWIVQTWRAIGTVADEHDLGTYGRQPAGGDGE